MHTLLIALVLLADPPAQCADFKIDAKASKSLKPVAIPPKQPCHVQFVEGRPLPDPACTPGAINPTVTAAVLRNPKFTTKCVRNDLSSEAAKKKTYRWYGITPPKNNTGQTQNCELDHLISLELGGSDDLSNIWPECGPDNVPIDEKWLKQKDAVEDWLAAQVRSGKMDLAAAQKGISEDWTQYLEAATAK